MSAQKVKVLFLAANPRQSAKLALDEEARAVEQQIRAAKHRDVLELVTRWAVRPGELMQHLLEVEPTIVHFCGHGSIAGEIELVGRDGQAQAVNPKALAGVFRVLKGKIRLVVLNACYTQAQAEAVTREIDCAVGMSRAVADTAAIAFAAAFYRALGFGCSVQNAVDQAVVALQLEGMPDGGAPRHMTTGGAPPAAAGECTPQLVTRAGVDAAQLVLVQPEGAAPPAPAAGAAPARANPVKEAKRQRIERQIASLTEDYEAASRQWEGTQAAVDRNRLERQMQGIEADLDRLTRELDSLG